MLGKGRNFLRKWFCTRRRVKHDCALRRFWIRRSGPKQLQGFSVRFGNNWDSRWRRYCSSNLVQVSLINHKIIWRIKQIYYNLQISPESFSDGKPYNVYIISSKTFSHKATEITGLHVANGGLSLYENSVQNQPLQKLPANFFYSTLIVLDVLLYYYHITASRINFYALYICSILIDFM